NGPRGFQQDMETIKMGHGAREIIENARVVSSWEDATAGLHWLVGTTHRKRRAQFPQLIESRVAAGKIAELTQRHRVGIIFGREESGLTDEELRKCQTITTIPSAAAHPALNLSQAVMVLCYEVFLASMREIPPAKYNLATIHEVEGVLGHLSESLAR